MAPTECQLNGVKNQWQWERQTNRRATFPIYQGWIPKDASHCGILELLGIQDWMMIWSQLKTGSQLASLDPIIDLSLDNGSLPLSRHNSNNNANKFTY